MAILLKPFVFGDLKQCLTCTILDGNIVRCSENVRDQRHYYEYDISNGILSPKLKPHARKAKTPTIEATRQVEKVFGMTVYDSPFGSPLHTIERVERLNPDPLLPWYRYQYDYDYSSHNYVRYIVHRFMQQRLDAKSLVQDLTRLDSNVNWRDMGIVKRHGGGYELEDTLESILRRAYGPDYETSSQS